MLFMAVLAANLVILDPIAEAQRAWDGINSYKVTLRARNTETGDFGEIIRYFYKKPGFIRMEFVRPYEGAVLLYNPSINKVKIRLSGLLKVFGVFTFAPDNKLVKSSSGHRVDESDIGALIKMIKRLQAGGKTTVLGDEAVGGRAASLVVVEGNEKFSVDGIHRYQLYLDKTLNLPLRVKAFDSTGKLTEEVLMEDLAVDVELKDELFKP